VELQPTLHLVHFFSLAPSLTPNPSLYSADTFRVVSTALGVYCRANFRTQLVSGKCSQPDFEVKCTKGISAEVPPHKPPRELTTLSLTLYGRLGTGVPCP